MVVAERVAGRDRTLLVVDGRGADKRLRSGPGQRADGAAEALGRQPLGLARARPEAGAPEETLSLCLPETALVDRYGHGLLVTHIA